ncbi:phospho-acceptor domain-containing protein [Geothermobacter ehrlichii]|uniref:histidine kinase n=1 Tax=Geothermobacter ehrlichii TaxID=213224 RepID=A0A5D3WIS4_9BACT|nr:ATP-binding protein [Geothermobacter ehrlichii]TYO98779.1 phospho-acceptor domain-containing protein [Geothermobacter ehrlichii]
MKLTIGRKLFLYTSSILVVVLLAAFVVLERNQSRQWERSLIDRSRSFARFATPEVMKRIRGRFSDGASADSRVRQFLSFNPDLVQIAFYSSGGRLLYRSGPLNGHDRVALPDAVLDIAALPQLAGDDILVRKRPLAGGGHLLDLVVPVTGPTGSRILYARYLVSFDRVDERIREIRIRFALIALVALTVSLLLAGIVARRFTRPLKELTEGVCAIGEGKLKTQIPMERQDEIGELAKAFNEMAASLDASNEALTESNRRLRQANEELQRMQEQLVRSERLAAIGQLAAGVSHEIDNPVGIILGYAELLLEDLEEGDSRREDVLAIIEECRRCRRITGSLLGLARSVPQEVVAVDMVRLVDDVFDSLRPQKLFRQIELRLCAEGDRHFVQGDADRLRQVLVNLMLNAAQAMEGAGTIRIDIRRAGDTLEILVADTGPGIPDEQREQVFQPFFSTKSREEGTGLGLSLCRKLVEDHGGRLDLVSSAAGACFRICLPVAGGEKSFDKPTGDSLP